MATISAEVAGRLRGFDYTETVIITTAASSANLAKQEG